MKKLKFLLFLSPVLFGMALPLFMGCNRLAPLLPPPPPTPTPQIIWANGSVGTWFTNPLTFTSYGACTVTSAVTAVSDPISGNSSALNLTATNTCGFYFFLAPSPSDPSVYYSSGHIQFDILLGQPPANITSMNIQYNNSISGNYAEYDFPVSLINSFSTSSFTHVSIPFTSFTVGNGYPQTSIDTPFQVLWIATGSGTSMMFDDIKWTFN